MDCLSLSRCTHRYILQQACAASPCDMCLAPPSPWNALSARCIQPNGPILLQLLTPAPSLLLQDMGFSLFD